MSTIIAIVGGSLLVAFLWALMIAIASLDKPINKVGVVGVTLFCLILEFGIVYIAVNIT